MLLTGVGAIPAGAWLDCRGARGLMTAGSLFAAGCVLLWGGRNSRRRSGRGQSCCSPQGAVLGSAVIAAVAVHLLAYLRLEGYDLMAAAAGALGVVQVAGRVVLTASARRLPAATAAALLLGGQAAGIAALLLISRPAGVVLFVVLLGAGFGVLSIARADLLARYAPRHLYARLSGVQALLVIAGEAAGPIAARWALSGKTARAERTCAPGRRARASSTPRCRGVRNR